MAPVIPPHIIVNNPNMTTEQKKGALRTRMIALSVGLSLSVLAAVLYLVARILKRRAARKRLAAETFDQTEPEHGVPANTASGQMERVKEGKYDGSGGYEATLDQTQGLLSGAQDPARMGWDSESIDVGEVQRPRSVASFTSAPPRYEEYRPQATGC
ncbi:hypothetical protein H2200_000839 [Cladophialophora chaetospira]|uniref:Uncharacterized protein n=1 Tax=Cladophialophora chaetospira TaxID=386627 RepID=A0AA38XP88_9EURO|nr:hypothetical protein H2200_000839 [Cladophialophora chaetospira]